MNNINISYVKAVILDLIEIIKEEHPNSDVSEIWEAIEQLAIDNKKN